MSARIGLDPDELGTIQAVGGLVNVLATALFAALSAVELAAARWIGRSLKKGGILGLAALVPGFLLSVGMMLPIWLVLHPIKFILLLASWRELR